MTYIDVFNGDADGLCALLQLRNAHPCENKLVTGVKRDIALVEKVQASEGDIVTVLDVSLDKNREAVTSLLSQGAEIHYTDHHFAGDIPEHPRLHTHINTAEDVCTSLLVNGQLQGRFAEWAVVGAFGDNLRDSAIRVAGQLTLNNDELAQLEQLGIYLNYNGYGASLDDLHFAPDALFRLLEPFARPRDFIADAPAIFEQLATGYNNDMAAAAELPPVEASSHTAVYILPNEKWARRTSGVFSNNLANTHQDRAHAVLTEKTNGNYLVSIRAPLSNKTGADDFCRQFPTGGGRAAAAGINDLARDDLPHFIASFDQFYQRRSM